MQIVIEAGPATRHPLERPTLQKAMHLAKALRAAGGQVVWLFLSPDRASRVGLGDLREALYSGKLEGFTMGIRRAAYVEYARSRVEKGDWTEGDAERWLALSKAGSIDDEEEVDDTGCSDGGYNGKSDCNKDFELHSAPPLPILGDAPLPLPPAAHPPSSTTPFSQQWHNLLNNNYAVVETQNADAAAFVKISAHYPRLIRLAALLGRLDYEDGFLSLMREDIEGVLQRSGYMGVVHVLQSSRGLPRSIEQQRQALRVVTPSGWEVDEIVMDGVPANKGAVVIERLMAEGVEGKLVLVFDASRLGREEIGELWQG